MSDAKQIQPMIDEVARAHGGAAPMINGFTLTDVGNGERFAATYGADCKFVSDWGDKRGWLYYSAGRWRVDNHGEMTRWAKLRAKAIKDERITGVNDDNVRAHYYATLDGARLAQMLKQASTEPEIAAVPEDFDRDPMLLNCANKTIDLNTCEARDHRREDMLTRQAPVMWTGKPYDNPDGSECPYWLTFLDRIMARNKPMIEFLQRAVGYSLTGLTTERSFFMLYGTGANGKSTFLEIISALLGDYAQVTPVETLLATRGQSIPNDLAALRGARFVTACETEENATFNTAKIKRLVGGDTVAARLMRGEFFNFRPQFKLWIGTNHKPRVIESSMAFYDRVKLVPFTVRIPEQDQEKNLKAMLLEELPGILGWALAGLKNYHEHGLRVPEEVLAATNEYREQNDRLGRWIAEHTYAAPGSRLPKDHVYRHYLDFCDNESDRWPIRPSSVFSARLKERGWPEGKIKSGTVRVWHDIALRPLSGLAAADTLPGVEASHEAAIIGERDT